MVIQLFKFDMNTEILKNCLFKLRLLNILTDSNKFAVGIFKTLFLFIDLKIMEHLILIFFNEVGTSYNNKKEMKG